MGKYEKIHLRQIKPLQECDKHEAVCGRQTKNCVWRHKRSHYASIFSLGKQHSPWLFWNTNIVLEIEIQRQKLQKGFPCYRTSRHFRWQYCV